MARIGGRQVPGLDLVLMVAAGLFLLCGFLPFYGVRDGFTSYAGGLIGWEANSLMVAMLLVGLAGLLVAALHFGAPPRLWFSHSAMVLILTVAAGVMTVLTAMRVGIPDDGPGPGFELRIGAYLMLACVLVAAVAALIAYRESRPMRHPATSGLAAPVGAPQTTAGAPLPPPSVPGSPTPPVPPVPPADPAQTQRIR